MSHMIFSLSVSPQSKTEKLKPKTKQSKTNKQKPLRNKSKQKANKEQKQTQKKRGGRKLKPRLLKSRSSTRSNRLWFTLRDEKPFAFWFLVLGFCFGSWGGGGGCFVGFFCLFVCFCFFGGVVFRFVLFCLFVFILGGGGGGSSRILFRVDQYLGKNT